MRDRLADPFDTSFIQWSRPDEAETSLMILNGRRIFGEPIRLQRWVSHAASDERRADPFAELLQAVSVLR